MKKTLVSIFSIAMLFGMVLSLTTFKKTQNSLLLVQKRMIICKKGK